MHFIVFAAVVAASSAPVVVAPFDETSQFKGDGSALKFDPSCRDYTLDSVAENPACAARVANLEAAPVLALAAHTLAETPGGTNEALDLLDRTATASGSPAVHYLLGSVLGTAQQIRPDYQRAVQHLTFAAKHGNPAAADLLASLLVEGKGAPRDLPKAIRLYEFAAANGYPGSALALGKLLLAGRYVVKDELRGRAWLDAVANSAVPPDNKYAASIVGDAKTLSALASTDAKISNFQLIPALLPADVKTIRYGTFDNPDIPPNFGFDTAFQKVHYEPFDDPATLARLERDVAKLPTPYLYELARRISAKDPERAMQLFLLARVRMSYDALRCTDPAAMEAVRAWDMLIGPDIRFLLRDPQLLLAAVGPALIAEANMAGDTQPWWVCRSGLEEMGAAIEGKSGPLRLKPATEWPQLRQTARTQLEGLTKPR